MGGERVREFPMAEGGEVLCRCEGSGQTNRGRWGPRRKKQGHSSTPRDQAKAHWEFRPEEPQFTCCNFVQIFVQSPGMQQ